MKVKIITLGCKVNHYDSQSILRHLLQYGYEHASEEETPDVFVINTCAVTNESERKSGQMIRRCRQSNPNAVIVVTGCVSELNKENEIPQADIVTGTQNRDAIPEMIAAFLKTKEQQQCFNPIDCLSDGISHFEGKTRATLKIQDGCGMYCTYCIIPYARNRIASMPMDTIIAAVKELCAEGYHEAVLTGIHLASYRDAENHRLIDVLEHINEETPIERLRLGSLEPKLLTEEFLSQLSRIKCFCPHFHISLQSGSNGILKKMNRRYTAEEYFVITENVRKFFPDAMITTDIIVGFPGETEAMFEETVAFVKKVRFSHVHVFPYSPKKGTPAADYPDQIAKQLKHRRAETLIGIALQIKQDIFSSCIGEVHEVLTETIGADGSALGYTENYLRTIIKGVNVSNEIVRVRIVAHEAEHLLAEKMN